MSVLADVLSACPRLRAVIGASVLTLHRSGPSRAAL
jgi:hypothetical protein